jgi:hypothetical protein
VGVLVEKKPAMENQEMKNMDFFVAMIHRVQRKVKWFYQFQGYMQRYKVNLNLVERLDALWELVKGHPFVEGEKHDMVVGKWGEGNNTTLHMVLDAKVHHK